jgi:hypothetical protein
MSNKAPYKFSLEQEVIVKFPSGKEKDGVISNRRRDPSKRPRYTVLFDDDSAETLIPEHWIRVRMRQGYLDV